MNQSLTLVGVLVTVLALLADKFGLKVEKTELETTLLTLMAFGGAALTWYGRYRQGDITFWGRKKLKPPAA